MFQDDINSKDSRADQNNHNILRKKLRDKMMFDQSPACHKEDKPWRRYPGCSRGCRAERTVERDIQRKKRRIQLKEMFLRVSAYDIKFIT
ncbi:hypothetical protein HDU76_002567 [Blyttiomyces sp. JEL0837]|nr:hypothetical protein HDU76_002567 [Blyttiomyces sp. JEL0837]